jgi:pyruvate/2-oxoglutarate/acetoin dehydrogenase E1 component
MSDPVVRELSMMEAIREAIVQEMRRDPRSFCWARMWGNLGGHFM